MSQLSLPFRTDIQRKILSAATDSLTKQVTDPLASNSMACQNKMTDPLASNSMTCHNR